MTGSLHPAVITVIAVIAAPLGLYVLFIGLGVIPFFQKHFLYAHKINTLLWTNLNNPEKWGFARNQVTPFGLKTSDGESIYAWHIMPLPLYIQHETALAKQTPGWAEDFTSTESFRLLKEDPEARVILYFHGNAGHITQAIRPMSYHTLTDTSSYHVLAIDYRGFGHSSGTPNEAGLIEDASALVDWVTNVAGIPSERVLLLGQSLGTAVVSGVAERYTAKGVEFAGIVLVSAFSDLATMLSEYRIAGLVPVLAPFRAFPWLLKLLRSAVVDKWRSDERLASIVRNARGRVRLNLVHAKNDPDIPWTEDNKLFKAAVFETLGSPTDDEFVNWKEERTIHKGKDAFVTEWRSKSNIILRQEVFPFGGHNDIMAYAPVSLAIMRSFDLYGTAYE